MASPAQADAVRRGIDEANAIRAQLGEAPLADQVTVVSDADAETVVRMMGEQDAVRDQLGLAPVQLVDLRAATATAPPAP